MKLKSAFLIVIGFCLLICRFVSAQEITDDVFLSFRVLPDTIDDISPDDMMTTYLHRQIDQAWKQWKSDYELRTDPQKISDHYSQLREEFMKAIGGLQERTPLNPKTVGSLDRKKYQVEKIIFESRPKHFVTANLYIPVSDDFTPPYPGVLVPCGHSKSAKAHDEYQSMGALLALNGMVSFVYDPIDQGERLQIRDNEGQFNRWGTRAHTINDIRAILLGSSVSQNMVWDGMRAIDYLQSRPEVNPELIGCTGNSGGGTQTAYLTALDDRIKVSAPSCYIHHLNSQIKESMGDAEQNIFGQLSFGMDHPDYLMMRGPIPIKILAATRDFFNIDAVWETYRYAKRFYSRAGYSERLDILENDAPHNYNREQREAAAQWMARWLLGSIEKIREPELTLFTEEELQCTPGGQTLLMPNARSVQDLQIMHLNRLAQERKTLWRSKMQNEIRSIIRTNLGIRSYQKIQPPEVAIKSTLKGKEYSVEKLMLMPEEGIYLPAVHFIPNKINSNKIIIYLHEEGKDFFADEIRNHVGQGANVFAVDLRGIGETAQSKQGSMGQSLGLDWEDWYTAYLLGKSYVSMRTEDIYSTVHYIHEYYGNRLKTIEAHADGIVGIPLLHAAALEPALFSKIKIKNCLQSWSDVVNSASSYNQLTSVVRGALKIYDLPDLVELLQNNITIENPLNALGLPVDGNESDKNYSEEPTIKGLAGVWYGSLNLTDPIGADPTRSLEQHWDEYSKRGRTWSAEWYGWIKSPEKREIEFQIETDQSVEVFIDQNKIITLNYGTGRRSVTVDMMKDKLYPVRIVYNQKKSANGFLSIKWVNEQGITSSIPLSVLFHSPSQHYRMKSAWR